MHTIPLRKGVSKKKLEISCLEKKTTYCKKKMSAYLGVLSMYFTEVALMIVDVSRSKLFSFWLLFFFFASKRAIDSRRREQKATARPEQAAKGKANCMFNNNGLYTF